MGVELIPAIGLLALVLLSPSGSGPSQLPPEPEVAAAETEVEAPVAQSPSPEPIAPVAPKAPDPPPVSEEEEAASPKVEPISNQVADDQIEYRTILDYIRSKYKNVSDQDARDIAKYLVKYSKDHDVDPKFIAALIDRESGFNKQAVSRSGARGLGQIKSLNYKNLEIDNPYDIRQNVRGTIRYVKEMMGNWKNNAKKVSLALASYYKGYGAVKRADGKLDRRTQGYVNDILTRYESLKKFQNDVRQKIASDPAETGE